MIPIINGDITKTDKDIIVQQVNCRGAMGKGLALTLMQRYPNIKKEYQAFRLKILESLGADDSLLGMTHYFYADDGKTIVNIFGQLDYRINIHDEGVYTIKEALLEGIEDVRNYSKKHGLSVAIPTYIGCGLAGGDWNEIKPEIERIFADSNVEVAFYHYR